MNRDTSHTQPNGALSDKQLLHTLIEKDWPETLEQVLCDTDVSLEELEMALKTHASLDTLRLVSQWCQLDDLFESLRLILERCHPSYDQLECVCTHIPSAFPTVVRYWIANDNMETAIQYVDAFYTTHSLDPVVNALETMEIIVQYKNRNELKHPSLIERINECGSIHIRDFGLMEWLIDHGVVFRLDQVDTCFWDILFVSVDKFTTDEIKAVTDFFSDPKTRLSNAGLFMMWCAFGYGPIEIIHPNRQKKKLVSAMAMLSAMILLETTMSFNFYFRHWKKRHGVLTLNQTRQCIEYIYKASYHDHHLEERYTVVSETKTALFQNAFSWWTLDNHHAHKASLRERVHTILLVAHRCHLAPMEMWMHILGFVRGDVNVDAFSPFQKQHFFELEPIQCAISNTK